MWEKPDGRTASARYDRPRRCMPPWRNAFIGIAGIQQMRRAWQRLHRPGLYIPQIWPSLTPRRFDDVDDTPKVLWNVGPHHYGQISCIAMQRAHTTFPV